MVMDGADRGGPVQDFLAALARVPVDFVAFFAAFFGLEACSAKLDSRAARRAATAS